MKKGSRLLSFANLNRAEVTADVLAENLKLRSLTRELWQIIARAPTLNTRDRNLTIHRAHPIGSCRRWEDWHLLGDPFCNSAVCAGLRLRRQWQPVNLPSPSPANLVSPLPANLVSPLPANLVSPLPANLVSPLPGNLVSPLPETLVSPLPADLVSPLPGTLVSPSPVREEPSVKLEYHTSRASNFSPSLEPKVSPSSAKSCVCKKLTDRHPKLKLQSDRLTPVSSGKESVQRDSAKTCNVPETATEKGERQGRDETQAKGASASLKTSPSIGKNCAAEMKNCSNENKSDLDPLITGKKDLSQSDDRRIAGDLIGDNGTSSQPRASSSQQKASKSLSSKTSINNPQEKESVATQKSTDLALKSKSVVEANGNAKVKATKTAVKGTVKEEMSVKKVQGTKVGLKKPLKSTKVEDANKETRKEEQVKVNISKKGLASTPSKKASVDLSKKGSMNEEKKAVLEKCASVVTTRKGIQLTSPREREEQTSDEEAARGRAFLEQEIRIKKQDEGNPSNRRGRGTSIDQKRKDPSSDQKERDSSLDTKKRDPPSDQGKRDVHSSFDFGNSPRKSVALFKSAKSDQLKMDLPPIKREMSQAMMNFLGPQSERSNSTSRSSSFLGPDFVPLSARRAKTDSVSPTAPELSKKEKVKEISQKQNPQTQTADHPTAHQQSHIEARTKTATSRTARRSPSGSENSVRGKKEEDRNSANGGGSTIQKDVSKRSGSGIVNLKSIEAEAKKQLLTSADGSRKSLGLKGLGNETSETSKAMTTTKGSATIKSETATKTLTLSKLKSSLLEDDRSPSLPLVGETAVAELLPDGGDVILGKKSLSLAPKTLAQHGTKQTLIKVASKSGVLHRQADRLTEKEKFQLAKESIPPPPMAPLQRSPSGKLGDDAAVSAKNGKSSISAKREDLNHPVKKESVIPSTALIQVRSPDEKKLDGSAAVKSSSLTLGKSNDRSAEERGEIAKVNNKSPEESTKKTGVLKRSPSYRSVLKGIEKDRLDGDLLKERDINSTSPLNEKPVSLISLEKSSLEKKPLKEMTTAPPPLKETMTPPTPLKEMMTSSTPLREKVTPDATSPKSSSSPELPLLSEKSASLKVGVGRGDTSSSPSKSLGGVGLADEKAKSKDLAARIAQGSIEEAESFIETLVSDLSVSQKNAESRTNGKGSSLLRTTSKPLLVKSGPPLKSETGRNSATSYTRPSKPTQLEGVSPPRLAEQEKSQLQFAKGDSLKAIEVKNAAGKRSTETETAKSPETETAKGVQQTSPVAKEGTEMKRGESLHEKGPLAKQQLTEKPPTFNSEVGARIPSKQSAEKNLFRSDSKALLTGQPKKLLTAKLGDGSLRTIEEAARTKSIKGEKGVSSLGRKESEQNEPREISRRKEEVPTIAQKREESGFSKARGSGSSSGLMGKGMASASAGSSSSFDSRLDKLVNQMI